MEGRNRDNTIMAQGERLCEQELEFPRLVAGYFEATEIVSLDDPFHAKISQPREPPLEDWSCCVQKDNAAVDRRGRQPSGPGGGLVRDTLEHHGLRRQSGDHELSAWRWKMFN